jgi:hypothetical protein
MPQNCDECKSWIAKAQHADYTDLPIMPVMPKSLRVSREI